MYVSLPSLVNAADSEHICYKITKNSCNIREAYLLVLNALDVEISTETLENAHRLRINKVSLHPMPSK